MKKLLAFLVLALGLVACGQKEQAAPATEQPAAEQAADAVDAAKEGTEATATEATTEATDAAKEGTEATATEAPATEAKEEAKK